MTNNKVKAPGVDIMSIPGAFLLTYAPGELIMMKYEIQV